MHSLLITVLAGAAVSLCFFCSFLLWKHSDGIRSRQILSAVMLLWGMMYILPVCFSFIYGTPAPFRGILSPVMLFFGNFAIIITSYYVIEIIRTGWLTWRRALLWLSPYLVIFGFYFLMMLIRKEPLERLPDMAAFRSSFFHFNVWFRPILLLVSLLYLVGMYIIFLRYEPLYRRWTDDNYSSTEKMDITWIFYYIFGFSVMSVVYLYALLTGSQTALVVHFLVILPFFTYINYKGLFQVNPYPEDFFHDTLDDMLAELARESKGNDYLSALSTDDLQIEKMKEFIKEFDKWMKAEKPYLNSDFKKSDVLRKFPVNRTYLSRVFQEIYNASFSQVVRRYRVAEAKHIMQNEPILKSKEISCRSGFSSDVAFHRTFMEVTGMTPKQYKLQIIQKE